MTHPESRTGACGLIDRFMAEADVRETHEAIVGAPAELVFAAACETDLGSIPPIRGIIRLREILLGAKAAGSRRPQGIVQETLALGWGKLAERPGRELVMGSVTKPWEADVVFRSVAPEEFAGFSEPSFVKIAWTIEAQPLDATRTLFRTQTRALGTDQEAKRRFRRYWRTFKAGIILIRWLLLVTVRREAERRFRRHAG